MVDSAFDLQEICDTGYGCLLSKISKSSNCSITWSHDMDCTCEECYIGTNGTGVPWRLNIIYYKFNHNINQKVRFDRKLVWTTAFV